MATKGDSDVSEDKNILGKILQSIEQVKIENGQTHERLRQEIMELRKRLYEKEKEEKGNRYFHSQRKYRLNGLGNKEIICYRCNRRGHVAKRCWTSEKLIQRAKRDGLNCQNKGRIRKQISNSPSFRTVTQKSRNETEQAQKVEMKCFGCQKPGHRAKECIRRTNRIQECNISSVKSQVKGKNGRKLVQDHGQRQTEKISQSRLNMSNANKTGKGTSYIRKGSENRNQDNYSKREIQKKKETNKYNPGKKQEKRKVNKRKVSSITYGNLINFVDWKERIKKVFVPVIICLWMHLTGMFHWVVNYQKELMTRAKDNDSNPEQVFVRTIREEKVPPYSEVMVATRVDQEQNRKTKLNSQIYKNNCVGISAHQPRDENIIYVKVPNISSEIMIIKKGTRLQLFDPIKDKSKHDMITRLMSSREIVKV